jgi:hypothetical protein
MAISNDLLSSTLYSIRDGEVDELFKKNAFLDMCKKKGGVEYEDGGIKIQRPLSLAEHSTITQLATGYEAVSLAVQDVLRPAVYEWCDFTAPIVITQKEELENSGEKAIVKILEARMRSVMQMLRKELNKQILIGNSAILTSMNTLNGNVATGFFEADDVGTQGNVVGGVSKATYAATTGWQNNAADLGANFGTTGIVAMQRESIRCSKRCSYGCYRFGSTVRTSNGKLSDVHCSNKKDTSMKPLWMLAVCNLHLVEVSLKVTLSSQAFKLLLLVLTVWLLATMTWLVIC